ncbi:MAG: hypothetical protein WC076_01280 [Terrimicrobiaceae bacterium]|jgi:uncharacterized membrane protein|nr:hypothetical protein [Terrimicrobiaceae bacterium]
MNPKRKTFLVLTGIVFCIAAVRLYNAMLYHEGISSMTENAYFPSAKSVLLLYGPFFSYIFGSLSSLVAFELSFQSNKLFTASAVICLTVYVTCLLLLFNTSAGLYFVLGFSPALLASFLRHR